MRALRYLVALVAVVALHALGARLFSGFPIYVDLFLVLTVAWAFQATPLVGLVAGLVAGLTADAFSGGLYGLNGFANTLVGFLTAVAVANLAKMSTSGAAVLYALAAVVQQFVLVVLVLLMLANPAPPALVPLIWKIAISAALGAVIFQSRRRLARLSVKWRQAREAKLRF